MNNLREFILNFFFDFKKCNEQARLYIGNKQIELNMIEQEHLYWINMVSFQDHIIIENLLTNILNPKAI